MATFPNQDRTLISEIYSNMYVDNLIEEGLRNTLMSGLLSLVALAGNVYGGETHTVKPSEEKYKNEIVQVIKSNNIDEIKDIAKRFAESGIQGSKKSQLEAKKRLQELKALGKSDDSDNVKLYREMLKDSTLKVEQLNQFLTTIDKVTDIESLASLILNAGYNAGPIKDSLDTRKVIDRAGGAISRARSLDDR
jgi:hypothetical protein